MTDTRSGLDAWTVPTLAAVLGTDPLDAEMALENSVSNGSAVRLTQGEYTFYVPGSLNSALTSMGVAIVEGERLQQRRADLREKLARARAHKLRDHDDRNDR